MNITVTITINITAFCGDHNITTINSQYYYSILLSIVITTININSQYYYSILLLIVNTTIKYYY